MSQIIENIPSSAIDSVEIGDNTVKITYKSSNKEYTYKVEDADSFEQRFLAEIPYADTPEEDDKSVGRFINQSINDGTLQLIADWPYHTLNKFVKGWLHLFRYQHPLQTIVDTLEQTNGT